MNKTGFFRDDNGAPSMMRLQSFMAFFVAAYVTWKIPIPDIYVLCAWLVAAFAPKVIQKAVEKWADIRLAGGAAPVAEAPASGADVAQNKPGGWPAPSAEVKPVEQLSNSGSGKAHVEVDIKD